MGMLVVLQKHLNHLRVNHLVFLLDVLEHLHDSIKVLPVNVHLDQA